MLFNTDVGGTILPNISNSIRLDGVDDYLDRTPSSSTDRQRGTYSVWVKRSVLPTSGCWLFDAGVDTNHRTSLYFDSIGCLTFQHVIGGANIHARVSTQKFRDTTSHYHVLFNWDVANATAENRAQIWVNGVRITSWSLSVDGAGWYTFINNNQLHRIGSLAFNVVGLHGGYLSNACFIDGQALTPSRFAYTDVNSQWRSLPKEQLITLTNTGGANSFFLPFDNGASTVTLGSDASSKASNWTLTNMVRNGSVNDCWSYDTPTNNFPTFNPLVIGAGKSTISNGALVATSAVGGSFPEGAYSTAAIGVGKWYCEFTPTSGTAGAGAMVGIIKADLSASQWYYSATGNKYSGGTDNGAYGAAYADNDVIGVAYDADNDTLTFYKNGVSQGQAYTGLTGDWLFAICDASVGATTLVANVNFGQIPVTGGAFDSASGGYFRYTPPSGYKALSASNLISTDVIESGSFTGNANADGPVIWCNGAPDTLTINGNAVTFGTHADKLATGFKLRTASSSYNTAGTNNWTATVLSPESKSAYKYQTAK